MSQINFKGKQFTQNHHLAVEYHELIPKKEKSINVSITSVIFTRYGLFV